MTNAYIKSLTCRWMRRWMCSVWLGALIPISHAHAAGFNCATADDEVSRAICASPSLSQLDERMVDLIAGLPPSASQDQPAWLTQLHHDCLEGDKTLCLSHAYGHRMALLYLRAREDSENRLLDICSRPPDFSDALLSGSSPEKRLGSYAQAKCTAGVVEALGEERIDDPQWSSTIGLLADNIGRMVHSLSTKRHPCDGECNSRRQVDPGESVTRYLTRIIRQYYALER